MSSQLVFNQKTSLKMHLKMLVDKDALQLYIIERTELNLPFSVMELFPAYLDQ